MRDVILARAHGCVPRAAKPIVYNVGTRFEVVSTADKPRMVSNKAARRMLRAAGKRASSRVEQALARARTPNDGRLVLEADDDAPANNKDNK